MLTNKNKYTHKHDEGKLQISLVSAEAIRAIAMAREHGVAKYKDPDGWKEVEPKRYIDAMLRHMLKFMEDPYGLDDDSGLPHLYHVMCNGSFLVEDFKDIYNMRINNRKRLMKNKDRIFKNG